MDDPDDQFHSERVSPSLSATVVGNIVRFDRVHDDSRTEEIFVDFHQLTSKEEGDRSRLLRHHVDSRLPRVIWINDESPRDVVTWQDRHTTSDRIDICCTVDVV